MGRDALQAQGAVRQRREVRDEDADDLGEAQRGDAEVVASEGQDRQGHQPAEEGRRQPCGEDGDQEGGVHVQEPREDGVQYPHGLLLGRGQDQDGGDVGADGHEARMSQGEHARDAVDEVQAQAQDAVDGDEVQDTDPVAVQEGRGLVQEPGEQTDGGDGEAPAANIPVDVPSCHILSSIFSPRSPVGRNSRMRIRIRKAKASL